MDCGDKRPVHAARLTAQIAHLVRSRRLIRELVESLCNSHLHLRRSGARKGEHQQALNRSAGLNPRDDALGEHGGFPRASRGGNDEIPLALNRE